MNRSLIILALLLFGAQVLTAQSDAVVPMTIRNNNYYNESLRQANLARLAYDAGDFDASIRYSEEAMRYANLSDEYVNLRLKMWDVDKAIYAAGKRLDYAYTLNAPARFPLEYSNAQAAYAEARSFRTAEMWDEAIEAANRVLAILAYIDARPGEMAETGRTDGVSGLPAQYTVRTWESVKDCLWNIAGRPWVYDDPRQWRLLYEANKTKMPETDNPDLIHPGMVLDIPNIRGEMRQGMWDANTGYSPLP